MPPKIIPPKILPPKQTQLQESAASLFSTQGYKKTTVDEIVEKANISKGLFYHYYKNKTDLYLHLYNTYIDILSSTIRSKVNLSETDFFLRLKQLAAIRIEFFSNQPHLWAFLYSAYYESHSDVEPLIREKNNTLLKAAYSGSASNIDWSKLQKSITPDQAIEMITWITEGFMRKIPDKSSTPNEELLKQFDQYMEYIKTGIYENENLENKND